MDFLNPIQEVHRMDRGPTESNGEEVFYNSNFRRSYFRFWLGPPQLPGNILYLMLGINRILKIPNCSMQGVVAEVRIALGHGDVAVSHELADGVEVRAVLH